MILWLFWRDIGKTLTQQGLDKFDLSIGDDMMTIEPFFVLVMDRQQVNKSLTSFPIMFANCEWVDYLSKRGLN